MGLVGSASINRWIRTSTLVSSTTTQTVNTRPLSGFKGQKFIISAFNENESKYKSLEILVSKKGSSIVDTVYGKIGDIISLDISSTISGSDVKLDITNNESFGVTVLVFRLDLI